MGQRGLAHWSLPLGRDPSRNGKVDAVVIGSGAGGAPVALSLARAGYRVVVLEKGPAYNQRDFAYDEIRSCRRDFFTPAPMHEPHVMVTHPNGETQKTALGWTANCVGGGTTHFSGFTYRLHPEDLRLRSILGPVDKTTLVDWPITWAQLEPYFERAEYTLGVSGDASKNPFEQFRRPLPLPPLRSNAIDKLITAAGNKLGLHCFPTARAILSQPWNGRAGCRHSFFCGSYGCETGAKSSTLAAIIPNAVLTGNCQVRPLCMAYHVETDDNGRATGVRYFDAKGNRQRLRASIVVVACSPIESTRLLLMSAGKAHPNGIGNHSGWLGKNLMFAGVGMAECEFLRTDPRMQAIDWREPFVNCSFQDLYFLRNSNGQKRKGGTVSFLFPHSNPIFRAESAATRGGQLLWGKKLKDEIRRMCHDVHMLEFEVFSDTLPNAESRVTLDDRVKDKWGLPVARFAIKPHPTDFDTNSMLVDKGLEVFKAMDGQNVRVKRRGEKTYWLQAGTARFGTDPQTSVLNTDCAVHRAQNVFVTDSSFMPNSGGVPNTLTIVANALRVGDRIVELGKTQQLFKKT